MRSAPWPSTPAWSELLGLLVSTSRKVLRLRWARASTMGTATGRRDGGRPERETPPPAARFALVEGGEQLGLLECGPKRGGPPQRPRPRAARDARPVGGATAAHREPGGRARGAARPDRAAGRRDRRPRVHGSSTLRTRSAGAARARHPRRRAAGAGALIGQLALARNQLARDPTPGRRAPATRTRSVRRSRTCGPSPRESTRRCSTTTASSRRSTPGPSGCRSR